MNPGLIAQSDQLLSVLDDLSTRLGELSGDYREQAEQDLQILRNFIESLPRSKTTSPTNEIHWPKFLENMHDSFLAMDHDWNLLYVNQRYAQVMGRDQHSLIGKNFWTEFPKYVGTPTETYYHKAMQERVQVNFQLGGVYSPNWYEVSIYPTQEGIAVFASDKTEQHKAEEALRESIAREKARAAELETIMNVVPAMIWIAHDRECKEMTGNVYGYEFLGMSQNDNISKSAPEEALKQQPYRNFKDGREIPSAELPMQVSASTGTSARDYEFDLVFRDGTVRTVLGNIEALRDANGQPSGAVAAFIDITARKQTGERTRTQNAILTGINSIFNKALTSQTEEALCRACLAVAEEITQSQFGFIREINQNTGKLDDITISDNGWDTCRTANQMVDGKHIPIGFTISGIYGRVLKEGKGFFTNEPPAHPDSIGTPPGHPPLTSFLGVPLELAGKTIGMIGLGNRPGGYGPEELAAIEALAPAIVQALLKKRAEEALQANQRTLQLFVEHAPAAIAMFDNNMRYLAASQRFLTDYHLGKQNIIGRTHYEVFPEIDQRWKEIHQRCLAGAVETCEEDPFPRQDGTLDWVRWEIHPWYNQQGKVGGLMMFTEVITERKQAQDALRASQAHLAESENRFRVAISSLPMTVFMLNRDLRYTWIYNPISAMKAEDVLGKRDDEVFPPETAAPFIAAKKAVIDSGQSLQREIVVVLNGKTEHFLLYLEPTRDEAGAITGFIGASVNITEQRQAEWKHREALTQMEVQRRLLEYREKERQVIARELHDGPVQTLSSLIFNVQFLKGAISDQNIQVELEPVLIGLKETVQDLRSMLNDLRPPSLIRFGLARALQIYLEDFREKHPEVILDFTLMSEPDHLSEQARLNLFRIVQESLTNVIKHSGANRVAIHLEAAGKQILLEIQDNGAGFVIAQQLVDYAVAGHFGIAGMKERTEALGGRFQIISAPGQGTTIQVEIKLRD